MTFIKVFSKESLNCKSQQFNRYQKNEQLLYTSNNRKHEKTKKYDIVTPDPDLEQAQHDGRVSLHVVGNYNILKCEYKLLDRPIN